MNAFSLDRVTQEQLLGRRVHDILTPADRATFQGQSVLVTGAGGTIGSELARQLAACEPRQLAVFDHSESALFHTENALRREFPRLPLQALLGDVSRPADIRGACAASRPDVVYHAAAYKHVTMTERAVVPTARVNVLGTRETAIAAMSVGARFVLISSDKAAESRSVMGASKRMAELVALGLARKRFRPIAVRFGNVLGSSGSVVEMMWRAVRDSQPVLLTHPDATRFFMTAQEAVSLVLKADIVGCAAEVFWLDMGKPLRIGTLAKRFIDWAAAEGLPRVGVELIGLRPGEKMHEHLTNQGLEMLATEHPRILRARQPVADPAELRAATLQLTRAVASGDAAATLASIQRGVADFGASTTAIAAAQGSRVSERYGLRVTNRP
jgi:FlaA1/EpsC-like NDP-sugar epimerase